MKQIEALESCIFPDAWDIEILGKMCGASAERLYAAIDDSSRVIGYCCCQTVLDECEILRVAVAPEYRRQNVGRRLLDFVTALLKREGFCFYFLEVRSDNVPALGLYEGLGFELISQRSDYYSKGCHALIYRRVI